MEITTNISALPDSPLFKQIKAYLGKGYKKITIRFDPEVKNLGSIYVTGSLTVAEITSAGHVDGWRSIFSDDYESINEHDVMVPDDKCFVATYSAGREAWVILYLNPTHLPLFKATVP